MIKRTLCFSSPAYLSTKNYQLVIKIPEVETANDCPDFMKRESVRTIPIEDIEMVILDHSRITLTHDVVELLLNNGAVLVYCDANHLPLGMTLPMVGNTTMMERYTKQIDASLPLKKQLWQQITQVKIRNQAAVLKSLRGEVVNNMLEWSNSVRSGDPDNLEGRAAAYYWRCMFSGISFTRDRYGVPPNNLLNYGYSILRAAVARALVSTGLLPSLGLHHHNKYDAYCLADDVMEPYRPYVDEVVVRLFDSMKDCSVITNDIKRDLLSILTNEVEIGGQRSPLMVAISQTTVSLYKCYAGESRKLVCPVKSI